jgi:microcystin-dependent protein
MTEPTTPNIGLTVPNTGDLSGSWATAALNPNFSQLDGMLGGVANISLSSATTITLTTPVSTTSFSPSAGPNQSSNAMIALSGTLSGNAVFKVTVPGVYRFFNNCATGSNFVQITPNVGTGRAVGIPDGELWHVFFDGTNCSLIGLPHVGTLHDFCTATTPAWMNAFTIAPYLLCNGATYSTTNFSALFAKLGSTFGGNGVNTFGVPDFQARTMIPLDLASTGRITPAGSGVDATVWGSAGGSQLLQQHTHTTNESPHVHGTNLARTNLLQTAGGGPQTNVPVGASLGSTDGATTGLTVNNAGTGTSGNIPPGLVGGLRFIKT